MLGALIIVFREVIEAGLIVGIVLAASRGVAGARAHVAAGVAAGVAGAGVAAYFADTLSSALAGRGQELFSASVLGIAVVMLAWHNIWMASHGREMARELNSVGRAVASGDKTLMALAIVVGVAVLREGAEVALFLYGVVVSGESGASVLTGGLAGLGLGALASVATFWGLVNIPPRHLFAVTSWLITLLAAGLAAQCAGFLQKAEVVTVLADTVWDTSAILPDNSVPGRVLRTLIGYTDQPSGLQLLAYFATLAIIVVATRLAAPTPRPQAAPAA